MASLMVAKKMAQDWANKEQCPIYIILCHREGNEYYAQIEPAQEHTAIEQDICIAYPH